MITPTAQQLLDELAERHGIAPEYYDIYGHLHVASPDTKRAILAAMGVKADSEADLARELTAVRNASWRMSCDPVLVRRADNMTGTWSFRMPAENGEEQTMRIEWTVRDEQGRSRTNGEAGPGLIHAETIVLDDRRYVRFELPLPTGLDMGYYDVTATAVSGTTRVEGTLRLILVPERCYLPPRLEEGARIWGLSLQLYALRSSKNWGVGDFGDLAACVEWAANDLGAGMIGLNPLHLLENTRPYHISPYSPDSRLYLNALYLDVERISEWSKCAEARRLLKDESFRSMLDSLREQEIVNYEQVYAAKRQVLALLFASFLERHCPLKGDSLAPRTARGRAFEQYVRQEGALLDHLALFRALSDTFQEQHGRRVVWQEWPEPYRHPRSPALDAYRSSHQWLIRFHQYLQWVTAEQLETVSRRAERLGMPVGLYHDLALGSDRTGSDAWMFQDVLALNADCGAPPDDFARDGQNWGLPPVIPHRLRLDGYRMFIQLLRKNLTYGGALRIDHVMSLFRLFWVPKGLPASAGAYVAYPWEDLLGILALESVRHRAVIIGEDLGTVPDFVREQLAAHRVLSYRVFYFERTHGGEWKAPKDYPRDALAVVATHDLPTLSGYWSNEDIELRLKLGLYPDEAAFHSALEDRKKDKARILRALRAEGLLEADHAESLGGSDWSAKLSHAIHAYVARTPSCLMLVSLEDLLGHRAQINVPGTLDAYPNWSLKMPLELEALRADPRPQELTAVLRAIRP
ncbi:MAG TPA: 4-alpha-glucanotransferase [Nitrospiraceae bacterium]|nr:4-alpha-glucanotransferase [Nitrospiraceae bacterium]